MKAIILAAGMGTRISKYIDEKPKCMVDVGGKTLLQYSIDLIRSRGISDIIVCIGYKADYIKSNIKDSSVKFVYNPFYDITNGIVSMWFAKEYLTNEETVVMSGDVFVDPEVLDELLKAKNDPVMLVDSTRIIDADYRFHFENGLLINHGKDLSVQETTGENLGMAKLGAEFVGKYKEHMIDMVEHQKHSVWWESVMYDMLPDTKIYVHDISGKFWQEVDRIEDYRSILRHIEEVKNG